MDDRLSKALEFSNYRQTLAIQRKTLKEKTDAKLTYGYNGGLFKIDKELILFLEFLISIGRAENIPIIDNNNNPILIDNVEKFKEEVIERYFTAVFEYYSEYQKIKESRSIGVLIDYE
jgi:hypothetical protein